MGAIESVVGEILNGVEDLPCLISFNTAIPNCTFDKDLPMLEYLFRLFLSHGSAHQVGIGSRVTGHLDQDADYLFLIDTDAVGFPQDGFQLGMDVGDFLPPMLAGDVVGYELHWTGAVEGKYRHDVLEIRGLHVGEDTTHSWAFHLKDASYIAAGE